MKAKKRRICVLLIGILLLTLCPQAFADNIDPAKDASLTIELKHDGAALFGAKFDIYYIASVDKNTHFTLTNGFEKYPVSVNNNSVEDWNNLAVTLKGYAQRDNVTPLYSNATDTNGKIFMDGMQPGLYLIVGEKYIDGGYVYTIQPTIVCLPGADEVDDSKWDYDVTIAPKYVREDSPYDETVVRKVLKVWNDNENKDRPKEIALALLADGKQYQVVILSAENNWRYEWDNLPACDESGAKIEWSVVEREVKNYTVKVEQNGITFVVTNTFDNPKHPSGNDDPKLPQTGLLWWPVPVLLCTGLVLIIIGLLCRRRYER